MTNVATGQRAEVAAVDYLKSFRYKVLDRNWRTRYCEIDIVARKGQCIYFVEVKYRLRDSQGSGLEYITPAKLRQMQFAAELWASQNKWPGDYALAAIEVSGPAFLITGFLPDIT